MSIKEDKELLKVQYELMVRQEMDKQIFNTNVHHKLLGFICSTLLTGLFFAWCSAGDTSYLPTLLKNNQIARMIVIMLPNIVYLCYMVAIVISAYNRRKK